jgi:single-strand DNA-binding protein
MARSVNTVVLLGNVGVSPSIRTTRSGIVAELSLATNERRPDEHGGWQEHTEWHTLVGFGRIAEIISEYVHVGMQLYIEGKLRTESWDDPNAGVRRYRTKIIVLNVVLLSRNEQRGSRETYQEEDRDFSSPYAHIPESEISAQEIPF